MRIFWLHYPILGLLPYIGTSGKWSDPVGARRRRAKALHRRTAWKDFWLHSCDVTHTKEPPINEWSHIRKRVSSHWWKFHAALMKESSMKVSIHAFSYERVISCVIYKYTYKHRYISKLLHMCCLPVSYLWHVQIAYGSFRCSEYRCPTLHVISMCDTTRSFVRHNSFRSVPWVINQFVWYVSFMNGSLTYSEFRCSTLCVSLICVSLVCDTRRSYVW